MISYLIRPTPAGEAALETFFFLELGGIRDYKGHHMVGNMHTTHIHLQPTLSLDPLDKLAMRATLCPWSYVTLKKFGGREHDDNHSLFYYYSILSILFLSTRLYE